jgi:hypothetical protein
MAHHEIHALANVGHSDAVGRGVAAVGRCVVGRCVDRNGVDGNSAIHFLIGDVAPSP